MEIIQSCLFTMLICTWSVQHLNVPSPRDTSGQILKRKIGWMINTVLFPEFVLAHAIVERDMGIRSMRHLKDLDRFMVDDRPWWKVCLDKGRSLWKVCLDIDRSLWKACLNKISSASSSPDKSTKLVAANPTGKKSDSQHQRIIGPPSETPLSRASARDADIEANPSELSNQPVRKRWQPISQPDDQDQQLDAIQWNLILSYYANMGGLRLRFPLSPSGDTFPINTEQLSILLRKGHIDVDELSDLSIDTILDKSKGDFFTKGLALVQVLWLMMTLLIRASRHLAITQLEILAVAFAICSTLTYGFRWNKPQDVRTAMTISACSHCEMSESATLQHVESLQNEIRKFQTDGIVLDLTIPFVADGFLFSTNRIQNDNYQRSTGSIQPVGIVLAVSTVSCFLIELFA